MALQLPTFEPITYEQANPALVGLAKGQELMQKAMMYPQLLKAQTLQNAIDAIKAKYAEPLTQADLEKAKLYNQYYGPNIESEMALRRAQTGLTGSETNLNQLKFQNPGLMGNDIAQAIALQNIAKGRQGNQASADLFGQLAQAGLQEQVAKAKYYGMGGGGMGVGQRNMIGLTNQIAAEHLDWSPEKVTEAANGYLSGSNQFSDGTPLPSPSGLVKANLDLVAKSGTTASALTGNIRAQQAEAELGVLTNYANKWLAPYGDTFAGYSWKQIADSFKSDPESQKQLGRFAASQALQFEIAQVRIRLAAGQPGITSTQEMMQLSQQVINARYPMLSAVARKAASDALNEAITAGYQARMKAGVGAYSARSGERTPNNPATNVITSPVAFGEKEMNAKNQAQNQEALKRFQYNPQTRSLE